MAAAFAALEEARRSNARRHQLLDLCVIAFGASLCGAESGLARADFAEAKPEGQREFLHLEGGPPSPDICRRVFRRLEPARWAAGFPAELEQGGAVCQGPVAIAGQTRRRAPERAAGLAPRPRLSAFACQTRLSGGQIAVQAHSNEIAAGRAWLSLRSLAGGTVRLEARPAPRERAPSLAGSRRSLRPGTERQAGRLLRRGAPSAA
jgi:DDE_Tnp_1-associated